MTTITTPIASSTARAPGGFTVATIAFVSVFAAGACAIPLYDTYRQVDGVTNDEFSLVAVAYFACAVFALLFLGRLSDYLGRKPVAIAALLIAAAGCVVLAFVDGFPILLVGRALQGLAAGVASSALGAYAVDTGQERPRWVVAAVTTASMSVGLTVGVFVSGALVEFAPSPRHLTYVAFTVVLLGCAVAVGTRRETVTARAGAWRSLRPHLEVPISARRFLPVAALIFVTTWALGGYFNSFGPSMTAEYLGSHSPVIAAAVFASYMAPGFLGGILASKFRPAGAQRWGMVFVALATIGLTLSSANGQLALFIGSGIVGGIGMGLSNAGSMNTLLPSALASQRAGLLAVVYAISYTGSALPSLVAGQVSRIASLPVITAGYAVLAITACVVTTIAARNPTAPTLQRS